MREGKEEKKVGSVGGKVAFYMRGLDRGECKIRHLK